MIVYLQSELQTINDELNEKLDAYKRKEAYGLYKKSSSESAASFSKESLERLSVISLVEKPSQQLAPTGEKFVIKTPKSSKDQIAVASDVAPSEGSKPAEPQQYNGEANEEMTKLKESLQRVQDELKIEKEKFSAFEVEFTSLQTDKVRVEQERSELEIQLEDVKRENERTVEELNQKLEDFERENKRYCVPPFPETQVSYRETPLDIISSGWIAFLPLDSFLISFHFLLGRSLGRWLYPK